jgi:hypothetical protein
MSSSMPRDAWKCSPGCWIDDAKARKTRQMLEFHFVAAARGRMGDRVAGVSARVNAEAALRTLQPQPRGTTTRAHRNTVQVNAGLYSARLEGGRRQPRQDPVPRRREPRPDAAAQRGAALHSYPLRTVRRYRGEDPRSLRRGLAKCCGRNRVGSPGHVAGSTRGALTAQPAPFARPTCSARSRRVRTPGAPIIDPPRADEVEPDGQRLDVVDTGIGFNGDQHAVPLAEFSRPDGVPGWRRGPASACRSSNGW